MYESYFGFSEKPFSIAPDPRFVYLSPAHEEALAHLLYGLQEGGGFVMLTGEVGTGKTTLLRTLLEKLPENIDVAMIFNPTVTPIELVATICDELKIPRGRVKASLKMLVDRLNGHLLETFAKGRRTVLIIDEAQALGADVLEQVRLLTNLETTREKLLEIILVGQPELRDTLARRDLRQLSQRITARFHLTPLDRQEVRSYVRHRLAVAGFHGELFSGPALRELARVTGGIPRLVNEIGDRCLLGAYAEEQPGVTRGLVRRASRQVLGDVRARPSVLPWVLAPVAMLVLVVAMGWWWSAGKLPRWSDVLTKVGLSPEVSQTQVPVVVKIEAPSAGGVLMTEPVQQAVPPVPESPVVEKEMPPESPADADIKPVTNIPLTAVPPADRFFVWVEQHRDRLTRSAALSVLANAWNIGQGDVSDCENPGDSNVRCTRGRGGWRELSALDLPAVLPLSVDGEQPAYIALTGLTRTDAVLRADGREWRFPRQSIDSWWNGEFLMLWTTPFAGGAPDGEGGGAVDWARRQLGKTFGQEFEASDSGDPPLQDAVRLFQRLSGLETDGTLNDATLLKLYAGSGPASAPRLWREG